MNIKETMVYYESKWLMTSTEKLTSLLEENPLQDMEVYNSHNDILDDLMWIEGITNELKRRKND